MAKAAPTHSTRNDVPTNAKQVSIGVLQGCLVDSIDLAERIVQLGGTANGTTQVLAQGTRLPPYPTDLYAGMDHVKALADRYAAVAKTLREGIGQTDEAGDADTADL